MSEGYVLTSALDANDLLNQIVGQAAVHGWTQNFLGALGSNSRRGHISKGGVTVNFASVLANTTSNVGGQNALNEVISSGSRDPALSYAWAYSVYVAPNQVWANPDVLAINAGSGFNGGLAWHAQPGADRKDDGSSSGYSRFNLIRCKGAIGRVHMFFFEDPVAIFVVAEVRPGEFYWLAAGMLDKDYPFEGGQFYGASLLDTGPGNAVPRSFAAIRTRCTHPEAITQRGNGWGENYQPAPDEGYYSWPNTPPLYYLPGYWSEYINGQTEVTNQDRAGEVQRGYSPSTGRLWAAPPRTYVHRAGSGHSYLGVLPHTHFTTVSHFIGGEVVSLGGVEYMIFPFNWRTSPYDWDVTSGGLGGGSLGPWYRNNCRGSGFMLRKPVA